MVMDQNKVELKLKKRTHRAMVYTVYIKKYCHQHPFFSILTSISLCKKLFLKMKQILACLNFLMTILLQPDGVNLRYFKFKLFEPWHWVAMIFRPDSYIDIPLNI